MCFGLRDFVCRRRFFVLIPPFCLLQLNIRPQLRHARRASCQTLHCEPRLLYLSEFYLSAAFGFSAPDVRSESESALRDVNRQWVAKEAGQGLIGGQISRRR